MHFHEDATPIDELAVNGREAEAEALAKEGHWQQAKDIYQELLSIDVAGAKRKANWKRAFRKAEEELSMELLFEDAAGAYYYL